MTQGAATLVLPTFFVIGAAKAGTTSLHHYLVLHPEIAMTEPKEPQLMSGSNYRQQARRYQELFAEPRPIRGESSTRYSFPASIEAGAAAHIAELVPEARLVYLVRDPIDRAIAHFAQNVIGHREQRPIEDAIRPEDPGCAYVTGSCYATVVEGYLRYFDESAMLVVDSRELRTARRETLPRIFAHLGATADFWDDAYDREYMVRTADNIRLGGRVHRFTRSGLGSVYRRLVPETARERLRPRVRRLLGGGEVRPELREDMRERLAARLGPEADRLRDLTGQRFDGWSL